MADFTLSAIRQDTTKRIFHIITENESMTRQEIAEKADFSLMTVGKITDILYEKNILIYEKSEQTKIGRKAEIVRLQNKLFELVLIFSGKKAEIILCDFLLNTKKSTSIKCADMTEDEIASNVLTESMGLIVEASAVGAVVGVTVVSDENNELCEKILSELKNAFSIKAGLITDYYSALSLGCAVNKSDKSILLITGEKMSVTGRYIKNLETVHKGIIKNKEQIPVLCDYLVPHEVYSNVKGTENDKNINFLDSKNEKKLVIMGAAFKAREEYALN